MEHSFFIKKQLLVETINELVIRKRRSKYTNEYFIDKILEYTKNFNSWSQYGVVLNKYTNLPKFHHKYLNEIYVKWSRLHIFEIVHKKLLNFNYTPNITNNTLNLNSDVTCISNTYGSENVGLNPEYMKKNVTKLGFLNDENNVVLSVVAVDNNKIFPTYKTLCSDLTTIQPLLNTLLVDIKNDVQIKINTDKGYISNYEYNYKNNEVKIITPPKQKTITQTKKQISALKKKIELFNAKNNMYKHKYGEKSKNYTNGQNKLKNIKLKINEMNNYIKIKKEKKEEKHKTKRYIIENYFSKLKRIPKLYVRTDKTLNTFMSTIFLAILLNYKITY